jgi:hypothetical protein
VLEVTFCHILLSDRCKEFQGCRSRSFFTFPAPAPGKFRLRLLVETCDAPPLPPLPATLVVCYFLQKLFHKKYLYRDAPDIRLAGYLAEYPAFFRYPVSGRIPDITCRISGLFFDVRYPAGYRISLARYPAGYQASRILKKAGYPAK